MPYYAVKKGRTTGIFTTWAECQQQTKGYPYPIFKKFATEADALNFMKNVTSSSSKSKSKEPMKAEETVKICSDANEPNVVFTDGCCFFNGKQGAVAGIGVFWGANDKRNVSEPLNMPGKPTNNRAEIYAAKKAIEQAKEAGLSKLVIKTDSEFLINSVTKWMPGWVKKNWVKADGKPVVNKEEFEALNEAMQDVDVKWIHVRGHEGIPGNEAADELAKAGAKMSKK